VYVAVLRKVKNWNYIHTPINTKI